MGLKELECPEHSLQTQLLSKVYSREYQLNSPKCTKERLSYIGIKVKEWTRWNSKKPMMKMEMKMKTVMKMMKMVMKISKRRNCNFLLYSVYYTFCYFFFVIFLYIDKYQNQKLLPIFF